MPEVGRHRGMDIIHTPFCNDAVQVKAHEVGFDDGAPELGGRGSVSSL